MPRGKQKGVWRKTPGGYGHTVIVQERSPGSVLYLRWWDPDAPGQRTNGNPGNCRWRSLGHRDRQLGEEQARTLASRLLGGQQAAVVGRITLTELCARYEAVSAHKKGAQPREDARRIELWTRVLGENRDPETITKGQIARFERLRREGRIEVPGRQLKPNPSRSTTEADIVFLDSVINWAVAEGLLAKHPFKGYDRPKTIKPRRPVASYERYERTRRRRTRSMS